MIATPAEMFAEALRMHTDARFEDVHVSVPGRIESYERTHQRAVVQPLVKRVFKDERGEMQSKSFPPITDVPVEFFGGGGYHLAFPVAKGMTCRLQFCSTSIDRFLAIGGEVDPGDPRRFNLSDAVCVLGLRDFAHPIQNLPSDAWTLVAPSGAQIRLGAVDASQKAIKGDAFKSALDTLIDAIASAVGGPGGTAISAAKTVFDTAAATWLSQIVRIK